MNLVSAHSGDKCEAARNIVRVQQFDEPDKFVRIEARSTFQANWIADTAHIFDMRAVRLARTITNPDHVRRCRIPVLFISDCITAS